MEETSSKMADPGAGDSSGQRVPNPSGSGLGLPAGRRTSAGLSPGRMPSMRSRDLTLGGVKKKTFTPNIIGRKVKEEPKGAEGGQRRERRDDRGRGQRERGRGRGRGEVIQSHSIFEQGPAEMMIKKRGVYEGERDAPCMGPSPIINIKKEYRETEEETKEILRKLERDNFIDDPFLRSERRSCPVQLPLAISGWGFKEEFNVKIEKVEEEIEPMDTLSEEKEEKFKKTEPICRPPPLPEPEVLPDLMQKWSLSKGEELFFMQLPDSLPGQPPTKEAKPVKTEVQSETGQPMILKTETQEDEADENCCSLKDLREGLVGKMLVRKSGRVQLILGQVTLDVSLGTTCSFLQELVSVGTEGKGGDMTVLGHIEHKMVCSPDFDALLQTSA
ncbi:DNA-directed RNA polymerase III subunit RPC4 isoform X1 [Eucyclogobius newberryi]|uniref:DNA-directed RNA polymerase III subunit RPC4 isoform X1 n=2 Tax=Eucyclogobius newberryi TaxID=166745 RepID=UPI003B5A417A